MGLPYRLTTQDLGGVRPALLQLVRLIGVAWMALALLAASVFTVQFAKVPLDPESSASALLALVIIAMTLAVLMTVAVVELARRGQARLALGVALAVLVAGRLLAIANLQTPLRTDWAEYHRLATMLAAGQSIETARPIGWPGVLSVLYRAGGPNPVLGELFNLGAAIFTAIVLFWVTRRAHGDIAAAAGTFLYAVSPAPAIFVAVLASEPLFAAALIGAVGLAVLALERGWWAWLATGAVLGIAQYVRPAALVVLPAFLALPILSTMPIRRTFVAVVLIGGGFGMLLVPNVVSKYEETGRLTLSTSNYDGFNLLFGLNEESGGSYSRDDRAMFGDVAETSRKFVDGPYRVAFERLRADPLVVARLAPTKFQRLWGDATYAAGFAIVEPADPGRAALSMLSQALHVATLTLALVGLLAGKSPHPVVLLAVLCLVATTLAAVLLESQARYHAPFEPLLCLLAGIGIAVLFPSSADAPTGTKEAVAG